MKNMLCFKRFDHFETHYLRTSFLQIIFTCVIISSIRCINGHTIVSFSNGQNQGIFHDRYVYDDSCNRIKNTFLYTFIQILYINKIRTCYKNIAKKSNRKLNILFGIKSYISH